MYIGCPSICFMAFGEWEWNTSCMKEAITNVTFDTWIHMVAQYPHRTFTCSLYDIRHLAKMKPNMRDIVSPAITLVSHKITEGMHYILFTSCRVQDDKTCRNRTYNKIHYQKILRNIWKAQWKHSYLTFWFLAWLGTNHKQVLWL